MQDGYFIPSDHSGVAVRLAPMELLGMKKMPNLVGKSVTQAKLTLPMSTQYVFVDHKSRNPGIVFNSNWKICKQEPAAGAQLAGYVVLTVVRRGEACKVSH